MVDRRKRGKRQREGMQRQPNAGRCLRRFDKIPAAKGACERGGKKSTAEVPIAWIGTASEAAIIGKHVQYQLRQAF